MTGPPCPLPDIGDLVVEVERWQYRTPNPAQLAVCRLRVWKSQSVGGRVAGGHIAVVTELPDNPGMSVTDAAEYILTALHGIYTGGLVVMEHYCGDRSQPGHSWARKERLDRVWLQGHLAQWQPVWPLAPSNGAYEAHSLWAWLYFEQATGCVPDLPAPLL